VSQPIATVPSICSREMRTHVVIPRMALSQTVEIAIGGVNTWVNITGMARWTLVVVWGSTDWRVRGQGA